MFRRLTGVSGIGPKSALMVLSAMSVHDLSLAIVTGDAQALARAPGIGKKTAQRIILELKDKVDNAELTASGAPLPVNAARGSAADEAVEALMALGYQASEAARAVSAISPLPEKSDEIIRLALKGLMK